MAVGIRAKLIASLSVKEARQMVSSSYEDGNTDNDGDGDDDDNVDDDDDDDDDDDNDNDKCACGGLWKNCGLNSTMGSRKPRWS